MRQPHRLLDWGQPLVAGVTAFHVLLPNHGTGWMSYVMTLYSLVAACT